MKRQISLLLVSLLMVGSVWGQRRDDELFKLQMAVRIAETFYVDTVQKNKLVEDAIEGMLEELDPHSTYISKEEVQKMNEPLEGSFDGIGIQFNILHDTLMVIHPIPGGPSEKVGIRSGDRIIYIDGDNIAGVGLSNQDVFDRLKGNRGTKVKLKIQRKGNSNLIPFLVIRDKIPIHSRDAAFMIDDQIGYLKLNRFGANTLDEFREALVVLQKEGMEHLILDLQGNGGGYLKAAIDLADEFLSRDKLIVYTEGITTPRSDYEATNKGGFEKGKLVILVDEGSASASEIVSGAIQDWDRGLIIGRRSFGKGLVQRPFSLPDGSMIRLTVARYYTPTGRLIQKPYDKGIAQYRMELISRYNNGELSNSDSIHFPDSLRYFTLVNQRKVYGGGGIMPDIFVPLDTTEYSDYYRDLVAQGILSDFVLKYVDTNRKSLRNRYPHFSAYMKRFQISDSMIKDLIREGKKNGVEYGQEQFDISEDLLRVQLKALIARDLWDLNEYFHIMLPKNEVCQRAIEIIRQEDVFTESLSSH